METHNNGKIYENDRSEIENCGHIDKHSICVNKIFTDLIFHDQNKITEEDIQYCVSNGIDINQLIYNCDNKPTTALIIACECRNFILINKLLKHGANPNVSDLKGITPLQTLLVGNHNTCYGNEYIEDIVKCLDQLIEGPIKLKRELKKHVVDICLRDYVQCEKITMFINSCIMITPEWEWMNKIVNYIEDQYN